MARWRIGAVCEWIGEPVAREWIGVIRGQIGMVCGPTSLYLT